MEHTKTPWHYEEGDSEFYQGMHFVCHEGTQCEDTTICSTSYGKEDAEFIVEACNNHDRLVAENKALLECLASIYEDALQGALPNNNDPWYSKVKGLLSKHSVK